MRLEHVGYAVRELDGAVKKFSFLDFQPQGEPTEDTGRGVRIQILRDRRGVEIELVAPLSGDVPSPVSGWLDKNGCSPYHLCYESEDLERDAAYLKQNGFMFVQAPSPAPALENRRVVFLYSRETGLLELVEKKE